MVVVVVVLVIEKEVVIAGANNGILHAFEASNGNGVGVYSSQYHRKSIN